MPETTPLADVLNRAADLIEPEGAWCQGSYGSSERGCFCMVGAVAEAMQVRPPSAEDCTEIWQAVKGRRRSFDPAWPHRWNDRPNRKQAEVVAALRSAADAMLAQRALGNPNNGKA